ncbi:deleted in malignant brain tumors 1 protein-like isoform X2 [Halichondria panicea]|uniref:deleted in malignant brain tumors 1 protein-like isoform X2 n=1 Tax=Halichondria panicea TaxID=6063 RepID=UPI00312B2C71
MVILVRCLVDWRSISTTSGGQSVTMDFNKLRQRGLADNLGFWEIFIMATLGTFALVKVLAPSGLIISTVIHQIRLRLLPSVPLEQQLHGTQMCTHGDDVALVCLGEGSVRLRSIIGGLGSTGRNVSTGLLEVYAGGEWGTVCNDLFDQTSADFVCRQMGYSPLNAFGSVTSSSNLSILLDNVQCTANDDFLLLCNHTGIGSHNCSNSDLELSCTTCLSLTAPDDGSILSYDPAALANGEYGVRTIATFSCDTNFGWSGSPNSTCVGDNTWYIEPICYATCPPLTAPNDGSISYDLAVLSNGWHGVGVVATFSCDTNFDLSGSTTSTCQGDHTWDNNEPTCQPTCPPLTAPNDGSISYDLAVLTNGGYGVGAVATFSCDTNFDLSGSTTSTCQGDHTWDNNEPTCQATCPPLTAPNDGSISYDLAVLTNGGYGVGVVATFSCDTNFDLSGSTTSTCQGDNTWNNNEPTCQNITVSTEDENVRLIGLDGHTRGMGGRVEVDINSVWYTISVTSATLQDTDVICRQLGFPTGLYYGSVADLGYYTSTSTRVVSSLSCNGSESRVSDCPYSLFPINIAGPFNYLAVLCGGTRYSQESAIEGDIRLNTDGDSRPLSGRLEIYINNQWGTVCDHGFERTEAERACKQLGLLGNLYYGNVGDLHFGQGSDPIWIDNINCSSEPSQTIAECASGPFGVHDCSHSDDVALVCLGEGSVRLRSNGGLGSTGQNVSTGLLEVYAGGVWGTVCNHLFNQTSADLACRQLGYLFSNSFGNVTSSSSSLPILLDDVQCTASDEYLLLCSHNDIGSHNCSHSEDLELSCSSEASDSVSNIGVIVGVSTAVPLILIILFLGTGWALCHLYYYKKTGSSKSNQVAAAACSLENEQPPAPYPSGIVEAP